MTYSEQELSSILMLQSLAIAVEAGRKGMADFFAGEGLTTLQRVLSVDEVEPVVLILA